MAKIIPAKILDPRLLHGLCLVGINPCRAMFAKWHE
jgi:ACR3 family arsenite efflux pump ArsB